MSRLVSMMSNAHWSFYAVVAVAFLAGAVAGFHRAARLL
jgi:hypothetical protein